MDWLTALNDIVWGPGMLVLLVGTGLYLTIGLRFLTFREIPASFKKMWHGRKKGEHGELSPFNALMTAMAATIGTGNIAGVATAIFVGGPGALFWMWMTALVGMATKFAEVLLAVHYREKTPAGNFVGGAMYFIKNGLGPKWGWMGTAFALFGVFASFGIGNMVQCNSISDAVSSTFGIPSWITAVILFLLSCKVFLGGVPRIGKVAGRVVPIMAVVYIAVSLLIIILNITELPAVFSMVVREAFTPTAAQGGFAGASVMMAIRMGMARGVFSNEAGLGSAPIAHATTTAASPMFQALLGMLDVFIDTIIVCSMTGFTILVTGQWTSGLTGASLTAAAFQSVLPGGAIILTICLIPFAFSTVLGWCVYGERCVIYLFGDRGQKIFRVIFCLIIPVGTVIKLDLAWLLSDTFNALMAIPNLIGVLLLSPVVFRLVREYRERGLDR
ncbi:MAG: sodium:alanine symporter family protein [Desulfovibrionaceae bacterium]|nr:sodium:alanine symporter family protein [Desulfovibrionaceae bacterium]